MSPDFIPHHALVTATSGAAPDRWMLVLHGILGSGANWRTFARRMAEARPGWGFILVDLRAHGQSQDPPAPHTLAAAAEDLVRLGDQLRLNIRGVMGHSFGGKVALAYLARRPGQVERAFVLDSDPSARPEGQRDQSSRRVLDVLMALPQPLASREAFFAHAQDHGLSRAITDWLAMNVRREGDVFRLRLDLAVLSTLLDDYFSADLWPVLEDPQSSAQLRVVLGGRSTTVPADVRARLEALTERAPWLSVRVLEQAGHWVHVDDPDGLFAAVTELL